MTPAKAWLAVSLALVSRTARTEGVKTDEGVGLTVGAGVTGFAAQSLRDTTSPLGGLWDLRAAFGTHTVLALEVGYVGAAMSIRSQLNQEAATLISTTFETDVRVNFAPHYRADPYVFAGLGWQRYTIDDQGWSIMETGVANRADARGTFRAVRDANLVLEQPEHRFAPMHNWEVSLAVGHEF